MPYFKKMNNAANTKTLAQVTKLSGKSKWKFFQAASANQIEDLTVPCHGAAHTNAHIDHCMVCANVAWGRMLKSA